MSSPYYLDAIEEREDLILSFLSKD